MGDEHQPNKWWFYGFNCKWQPSGTGTTSAKRREQRRQKQWENLVVQEPDNEEKLGEHVAALEKAAKKAQQKLQDLKEKQKQTPLEKGGEAQGGEEESYYS